MIFDTCFCIYCPELQAEVFSSSYSLAGIREKTKIFSILDRVHGSLFTSEPKNFQRFIICSFNIYSEIKKTLVHFMTFGRVMRQGYQLLYFELVVNFYWDPRLINCSDFSRNGLCPDSGREFENIKFLYLQYGTLWYWFWGHSRSSVTKMTKINIFIFNMGAESCAINRKKQLSCHFNNQKYTT